MSSEIDTLRGRLGHETVLAMQEILTHAKKRAGKITDLEEGIWYPSDYLSELKRWQQPRRITWFKDKRMFYQGYAPTKYFDPKPNSALHFIAKKTVNASQALMAAINGLGLYDCGMVCQLARYRAIERLLGEEKFVRLFDSQVKGAAINIGYLEDDALQPMRLFVDFPLQERTMEALKDNQFHSLRQRGNLPVKEGQLVFMHGVAEYKLKHSHGDYGAFNLICSQETQDKQRFLGFGLNPEGETEEAIYQKMIADHNKAPTFSELMREGDFKAIQTERQLLDLTKYDQHTSHEVLGFMPDGIQDFKIALIWQLIQTPVEKIKPALEENYS